LIFGLSANKPVGLVAIPHDDHGWQGHDRVLVDELGVFICVNLDQSDTEFLRDTSQARTEDLAGLAPIGSEVEDFRGFH
jgi:hypothetical protein